MRTRRAVVRFVCAFPPVRGPACEQRTVETLRDGKPSTPFMRFGDVVRIEMLDANGNSIFGAIEQRIERHDS